MKPAIATAFASALAVATFASGSAVAQEGGDVAAQTGPNHAAIVIDTGDGTVRKLCLTFPEAEISGIEALRRVDTRPNRFETFSGKGSGVCMLCGVGCEAGACFCDRNNYWAYHRSGPSESSYRPSAVGASSTVVRDGDVEAWRWGPGSAPAKTSVSEVCAVPEPPARPTGGGATTTSPPPPPTTQPEDPGAGTGPGGGGTGSGGTGASVSGPFPSPTTSTAAPAPSTTSTLGAPTSTSVPGELEPPSGESTEASPAPLAEEADGPVGAEDGTAAAARTGTKRTSAGQLASLAAFTALLAGLLVWRSRLRRAKVRPEGSVR